MRVSWSLPSLPKLEDIKDLFRQIMPPQARHLFFFEDHNMKGNVMDCDGQCQQQGGM